MKINWKVRFKNKAFWMALIPAVLLLASQVCAIFGVQIDTAAVSDQLIGIVGTVFTIFALLGIVNETRSMYAALVPEPKMTPTAARGFL